VLGLTALSWILLIPAVLCWPAVFFAGWLIWRASKRHEDEENAQRQRLLEAARSAEQK
jgi:hypothetical protein